MRNLSGFVTKNMPKTLAKNLAVGSVLVMLAACGGGEHVQTTGQDIDYHAAIRPQHDRARLAGPAANPDMLADKAADQINPNPVDGPDVRPRTRPVKVALLVPLTGQGANIGQSMMHAAEIATFQLADENFTLLPFDTKGTAEGAKTAIDAAIAQNAELVIGPLFAAEVAAIRDPAKAAGVNVLSFTTDRQQAGDHIFVSGFLPGAQVERIIGFARARNIGTFGILAPEGAYGDAVLRAAQDSLNRLGGTVTRLTRYRPDVTDLKPVIDDFTNMAERTAMLAQQRDRLSTSDQPAARRALKEMEQMTASPDLPYQAVLVADGGNRMTIMAPMLAANGLSADKVQWLGTGLWDDPAAQKIPALYRGWYAAPEHADRSDFEQRYQAGFGTTPPRLASLAYDTTALAAVLARQNVDFYSQDQDIRDAAWTSMIYRKDVLTNPNGFSGADGIFRLLPDGTVERGLAVMEITPDGPVTRNSAPATFVAPGS